jgi:hypothetical protein
MGCTDLLFTVVPWFGLLILLNAIEIVLLINLWGRLRVARDTVMDAVEARLLEVEKEGARY